MSVGLSRDWHTVCIMEIVFTDVVSEVANIRISVYPVRAAFVGDACFSLWLASAGDDFGPFPD